MYLIVGATGSLGGKVATALLATGERVRVVARPGAEARRGARFTDLAELRRLGAEVVAGDLRQPETLAPHLSGVAAVLMTASGTKRAPPDTLEAVDVAGAGALARAAKQAGVEHLVFISASGAGPEAVGIPRLKWEGENAVRASGMLSTIVRPAMYMQDWIGFVLGAQLQGGGRIQLVGSQDPTRIFVHEDDVAKLVTALLLAGPHDDSELVKTVEYATESASHEQIAGRMARATGLPVSVERIAVGEPITTVPEPQAGLITYLLSMVADAPSTTAVTPEVNRRYGIEPASIDVFLSGG